MNLTCLKPPLLEPVNVRALRHYLRMDCLDLNPPSIHADSSGQESTILEAHIASARATVEQLTGQKLMTQTWRCTGSATDIRPDSEGIAGLIVLPLAPMQTITSVYIQGHKIDDWCVDKADKETVLRIARWPIKAWSIECVVGYGNDQDTVPQSLRLAIMAIAGRLFDHPDQPMSQGIRDLIQPFRRMRIN